MTRAERRVNRKKGSTMIEGALALSIFLMVVYAFVQFCLIVFGFDNATYASRIAVRYAIVHDSSAPYTCTAADIFNIVSPLLWGAPSGGTSISTSWSPNHSPGGTVSIKVTIQYAPKLPFFPSKIFTVGTPRTAPSSNSAVEMSEPVFVKESRQQSGWKPPGRRPKPDAVKLLSGKRVSDPSRAAQFDHCLVWKRMNRK